MAGTSSIFNWGDLSGGDASPDTSSHGSFSDGTFSSGGGSMHPDDGVAHTPRIVSQSDQDTLLGRPATVNGQPTGDMTESAANMTEAGGVLAPGYDASPSSPGPGPEHQNGVVEENNAQNSNE